ncbi:MAG: PQQ-binding-like beta-propeller repeat protein [Planctomycetaceae bacterium]|nr:PQQ-binding-like beta-propeller repeat protein [Planctomycetaceae bacterium]
MSHRLTLLLTAAGLLVAASIAAKGDDWPQWRGPNRDAFSKETGLKKEWPEGGPAVLWQVENAGIGYSSLAVSKGRVYTQGDLDGVEHTICWNEADGKLLWAVQPEPVREALEKQLTEQFSRFDKNQDGKLDELEALSAFGWNYTTLDQPGDGDPKVIARKRCDIYFAEFDKDKDGKLSGAEIPGPLMGEVERLDREDKSADGIELAAQRAAAGIARCDKDGDGAISKKEADGLISRIFSRADTKVEGANKGDDLLTEAELKTYYFSKEPGRDGAISRNELQETFERNFATRDGELTKADVKRNLGGYRNSYGDGPRGTPTVVGGRIYVEGGSGDVACLDAETGKTIWHLNLSKDLGGVRPGWGYCESPLVYENLVIVTPGGAQGTLAALDKETGKVVWRSTEVKEGAHYASPQIAEIAGVKQIVQFASKDLFAVTLDGQKLLWNYSAANNGTANIATPLIFGDHVLASSAYGTGSGLVKVSSITSESQKADEVYFTKKLANHHGGLVRVGDHVYGFGEGLMCLDFLTGDVVWKNRSVGKGSLVYADGMLYCLGEGYEVALVEATPESYKESGRFKIDNLGRPAWSHPVVANGRLYLRNMGRLTVYDVKE